MELIRINTEISGVTFNEIYKDIKFYKFLNDDLIHNNFKYEIGLNIDPITFNPSGSCSKGGLYFCEESKCYAYWQRFGKKISLIKIPNDARVYIEIGKFKTDKIIITEIIDFCDFSQEFWLDMLTKNGNALEYVKDAFLTEEICRKAVQQDGYALRYVKEQNEEICKLAVQQDGDALEFVKEQYINEEICVLAVQQDGCALRYVKEQNKEICSEAVQQNGYALRYVKEQNEEICMLAVQQNGYALQYVKEQFQTEELRKLAGPQNSFAIDYGYSIKYSKS